MEGRESGTVKAWMEERGMGFITPANGGLDHFVHRSMLTDGQSLQVGGAVTYVSSWDAAKGKPIADQIQGAVPAPAAGAVTLPGAAAPAWSPAAPAPAMPAGDAAAGTGTTSGTCKAWIEARGMGFITPEDGSADLFVHRSNLVDGQSLVPGCPVRFDQGWDAAKNKGTASNVTGACPALGPQAAPASWPGAAPAAPPSNDNLYIAGLPADSNEESIAKVFGQYGTVTSVKMLPDNGSTGRVALVRFGQVVQAEWIVWNLNGNIPLGLEGVVQVKYANNKPDKGKGAEKGGCPGGKPAYQPAGFAAPAGKGPAPKNDNLYIAGLPWDSTAETVTHLIGQYGTVTSAKVMDATPGKPDRVALVRMGSIDEAQWLVENVDGNIPSGLEQVIQVKYHIGKAKGEGYGAAKGGQMIAASFSPYGKGGAQAPAFAADPVYMPPPLPPPPQKKDTLNISGLPADSTEDSIKALIGQYGTVTSARITPDSSGAVTAVVQMGDAGAQLGVDTAQWLVENLDGNIPQGLDTPISVKHAAGQAHQAGSPAPAGSMPGFTTGTVKHWVQDRGMGFITPTAGGQDCFVHQTNLVDGMTLVMGTQVTFKQEWDMQKNKPTATHVTGAVGGDGVGKGAGKFAAFKGKGGGY